MNIAKNLERSAFYFPEKPALTEDSCDITYKQLNEQANSVATSLIQMGVRQGDHVGLCSPNSSQWVAFYFGVLKAGAVAVTLPNLLTRNELELLVDHAQPRFLFCSDDKTADLSSSRANGVVEKFICPTGGINFEQLIINSSNSFKAIETDRSDTAVLLYTGGTTGMPKGVLLSHENINASIQTVVFNERSNEKDRALCFLPFNHVFGQMHIMNATILSGGSLELIPSFDLDRILSVMKAGRVTKLFAVPTIFRRLLSLDSLEDKTGSIRYCFSAAASMPVEFIRQWKSRTGMDIYEGYGMTEAAPAVTYNHYYRHVVGSVGTEVPGVEVQIRDTQGNPSRSGEQGEICIRGRNITKGYFGNEEATRAAFWDNGWFRSGDIGLFDEDGYLYIVDRLKDMIITGGENVYPREVEEVLYARPEVEECAIIGLPDQEWGERVVAFVVPATGEKINGNELKHYLKKHLSPFKVPKAFHAVSDLPKSPAGKILKRKLKEQIF